MEWAVLGISVLVILGFLWYSSGSVNRAELRAAEADEGRKQAQAHTEALEKQRSDRHQADRLEDKNEASKVVDARSGVDFLRDSFPGNH